jgi:hypothetical protein
MVQVPDREQSHRGTGDRADADIVSDAKLTGSPEEAVAAMVNGAAPSVWFGSAPKAMVCAVRGVAVTMKLC